MRKERAKGFWMAIVMCYDRLTAFVECYSNDRQCTADIVTRLDAEDVVTRLDSEDVGAPSHSAGRRGRRCCSKTDDFWSLKRTGFASTSVHVERPGRTFVGKSRAAKNTSAALNGGKLILSLWGDPNC